MTKPETLKKLIQLIQENPDLPVIPLVHQDVYLGDDYAYSLGELVAPSIDEVLSGESDTFYIRSEVRSKEDVLYDRTEYTEEWVDNATDAEIDQAFDSLPWKRVIIVYVDEGDGREIP